QALETWPTVRAGLHFLLPIGTLIWCLMVRELSPALSAFWAIVVLLALMLTQRPAIRLLRRQPLGTAWRQGLDEVVGGLIDGSRNMTGIGVATATAGIIVGGITLTGLGLRMTEFVEFVSQGNVIVMLLFIAFVCLVLGLGVPTTANYVLVATLMAPVVVELGAQSGLIIPLIAVHLFVFYYGIMGDITPPVGLATFAAAAISGEDAIRTGIQGSVYALRTVILPFIWIFNPTLLLVDVTGGPDLVVVVLASTLAMLLFTALTMNWLRVRLAAWEFALLALAVMLLFRPDGFMDFVGPEHRAAPASQLFEVAGRAGDGERVVMVIAGTTLEGRDIVKTVALPLGAAAPAAYAGRFIIARSTNGVDFTNVYTSASNESSYPYTIPAGTVALRVRFYLAGGTSTLLDEELLSVVTDGANALGGVLTNAAHVVPTASDGSGGSYSTAGGRFAVFDGGQDVTAGLPNAIALQMFNNDLYFRTPSGLSINGTTFNRVRARFRPVRAGNLTWDGALYFITAATASEATNGSTIAANPGLELGKWVEVEWTVTRPNWAGENPTRIRIDLTNNGAVGDLWEVDWVRVVSSTGVVGAEWNFESGVEGFTANHAYVVHSPAAGDGPIYSTKGAMVLTSVAASWYQRGPTMSIAGSRFFIVRARLRYTSGAPTWGGTCFYQTSGHGEHSDYRKTSTAPAGLALNEWVIAEWDMSALTTGGTDWITNTITRLRIDPSYTHPSTWEVDWVEIVDAAGNVGIRWDFSSSVEGWGAGNANVTVSSNGAPTGGLAISIDRKTGLYSVSALSSDAGEAILVATYKGQTVEQVYSISKSKAGVNGIDGEDGDPGADSTSYWLLSSAAALTFNGTAYTPATITFTAKSATGAAAPANYAGRFIIAESTDGTSFSDVYTSASNEASRTHTPGADVKIIRCRMYQAGGTSVLLDETEVPVTVNIAPSGSVGGVKSSTQDDNNTTGATAIDAARVALPAVAAGGRYRISVRGLSQPSETAITSGDTFTGAWDVRETSNGGAAAAGVAVVTGGPGSFVVEHSPPFVYDVMFNNGLNRDGDVNTAGARDLVLRVWRTSGSNDVQNFTATLTVEYIPPIA
ncbi:MAG TPA: DUF3394 domain-containing protein, partial [Terricaulis sp.]|nr:DUF3394 domain-containing protein [Terricaulis sp.]